MVFPHHIVFPIKQAPISLMLEANICAAKNLKTRVSRFARPFLRKKNAFFVAIHIFTIFQPIFLEPIACETTWNNHVEKSDPKDLAFGQHRPACGHSSWSFASHGRRGASHGCVSKEFTTSRAAWCHWCPMGQAVKPGKHNGGGGFHADFATNKCRFGPGTHRNNNDTNNDTMKIHETWWLSHQTSQKKKSGLKLNLTNNKGMIYGYNWIYMANTEGLDCLHRDSSALRAASGRRKAATPTALVHARRAKPGAFDSSP